MVQGSNPASSTRILGGVAGSLCTGTIVKNLEGSDGDLPSKIKKNIFSRK